LGKKTKAGTCFEIKKKIPKGPRERKTSKQSPIILKMSPKSEKNPQESHEIVYNENIITILYNFNIVINIRNQQMTIIFNVVFNGDES
jgi:hypothetical protein